jgi:hypothetical protein
MLVQSVAMVSPTTHRQGSSHSEPPVLVDAVAEEAVSSNRALSDGKHLDLIHRSPPISESKVTSEDLQPFMSRNQLTKRMRRRSTFKWLVSSLNLLPSPTSPVVRPAFNLVLSQAALDGLDPSQEIYFYVPKDPFYPRLPIVFRFTKSELLAWQHFSLLHRRALRYMEFRVEVRGDS